MYRGLRFACPFVLRKTSAMNQKPVLSEAKSVDFDAKPLSFTPPRVENLLVSATELFLSIDRHDRTEIKVYQELAENLLSSLSIRDRRRISCQLVRHPDAPGQVLERLAGDPDPLTAYPALRHAPSLSEAVLLEQAEHGTEAVRKAIAARPSLSGKVLEALAAHGNADVVRLLMERKDVDLDRNLLEAIEDRDEIIKDLGPDLTARGVLSSEQLMSQFLHLTPELRMQAIAGAELANLVELAQEGAHRRPKPVFKAHLLDLLFKAALSGPPEHFATDLAFTLGLPEKTALKMLEDDSGEALAVAFKALGFSPARTTSLLVCLLGKTLGAEDIRRLGGIAENISDGAARLLVRRWVARETLGLDKLGASREPVYQEAARAGARSSATPVRDPKTGKEIREFRRRA